MSWWRRVRTRPSARAAAAGSGSVSRKLPPTIQNDVERAAVRGVHHLGRGRARGRSGSGKPHTASKRAPLRFVEAGRAAHLGPALHARVAADRHEAGLLAAHPAPRQAHVDERLDGVARRARAASGPSTRRGSPFRAAAASPAKRLISRARGPAARSSSSQLLRLDMAPAPRRSPSCARRTNSWSSQSSAEQDLEHAVQEREVAAGVHREPVVRDARAEQRGLGHRGHPVAREPGLVVRVDDRHVRAVLPRVVEVLHGDRLVVGVFEPKNTMRSVPSQSVYEQVVAP